MTGRPLHSILHQGNYAPMWGAVVGHWRGLRVTQLALCFASVIAASCVSDDGPASRDVRAAPHANSTSPLPEISPAQFGAVRKLVEDSGFVTGGFEIASATPALDEDGNLTGAGVLVRLEHPLEGEITLPSRREGIDEAGNAVPIGYDTTYSVQNLSALTFFVDFADPTIRWVAPGDANSATGNRAYGEVIGLGNGPERRLDGVDGPIPPRQEGR